MIKQETHVVKGMQRDLTVSKFSPEYAFDAQNIRITARDHNTLLSITNEKGNKEIELRDKSNSVVSITGTTIGYQIILQIESTDLVEIQTTLNASFFMLVLWDSILNILLKVLECMKMKIFRRYIG